MEKYEVGSLVNCRDREWVVVPSDRSDILMLRPLGGGHSERVGIYLPLQEKLHLDEIRPASFARPKPEQAGDQISGRLLRDATRLTFRTGAGPFRSLGRIAVKPRPFQIVPLLMALRLPTVRLLIADDVGIGKTIEAGLIARELLDRGEARRLVVICPPHLCDQWQRELAEKFALDAQIVRPGTLAQLERAMPQGDKTVFEHYPYLVVSIDFMKSERHKYSFLRTCPELVIVDEAHTAARSSSSRGNQQQRHELLRQLAADPARHMLLLTATPHSGVEDAFKSLLELLDQNFGKFDLDRLSEKERGLLARHLIQRRRVDVTRWLGQDTPFPQRESREVTYSLTASPDYRKLFEDVYDFARGLVRDNLAGMTVWKQRVRYWTALALLRCVMSSPAAAEASLRNRANKSPNGSGGMEEAALAGEDYFTQYVMDLDGSEQEVAQDFDPTGVLEEGETMMAQSERARLQKFAGRAARLAGENDPKLQVVLKEITGLLRDGYHPIIYCRFIATAEYLATQLKGRLAKLWPDLQVVAVTGNSAEEEREERVAELSRQPRRLLVATDCLSEGINLQAAFNAVVHYDLPWNPNRLEQREGRVDRYGQSSPIVRRILLYGSDNPIDQAVMKVLLRKAMDIHKSLGITVPLPVDSESVVESVVRSLFKQENEAKQLSMFDLDGAEASATDQDELDVQDLHSNWDRAAAKEKESRTRFAQHAIKPEEVAQELYETDVVLGDAHTVADFVLHACQRLNAPLLKVSQTEQVARTVWRLPLHSLPPEVRERVRTAFSPSAGKEPPSQPLITFEGPVPEGVGLISRLHPLTEALAEYLLETALEAIDNNPLGISRCGTFQTSAITRRTTVLLLRLRLLIEAPSNPPLLAEEMLVIGFEGRPLVHDTDQPPRVNWLADGEALRLLQEANTGGNLSQSLIHERLKETLDWLPDLDASLAEIAEGRAKKLLEAHRRVRQATHTGRVNVRPAKDGLDVLGFYVFLPVPKGMLRP